MINTVARRTLIQAGFILAGIAIAASLGRGDKSSERPVVPADTTDHSSLEEILQIGAARAQIELQQDADTTAALMQRYRESHPSISDEELSAMEFYFWDSARVANTLARMPS